MANKTHYVVPNSNGGWELKKDSSERASNLLVKSLSKLITADKFSRIKFLNFTFMGRMEKFNLKTVMVMILIHLEVK